MHRVVRAFETILSFLMELFNDAYIHILQGYFTGTGLW